MLTQQGVHLRMFGQVSMVAAPVMVVKIVDGLFDASMVIRGPTWMRFLHMLGPLEMAEELPKPYELASWRRIVTIATVPSKVWLIVLASSLRSVECSVFDFRMDLQRVCRSTPKGVEDFQVVPYRAADFCLEISGWL